MNIKDQITLNKKAVAILEAIERCNYLIYDAKKYLNNNTQAPWFECTKHIYIRQHNKYKAIRYRLLASYSNIIQRIAGPVLNNAAELGTIVINENGKAEPVGIPTLDRYTQEMHELTIQETFND